jgi:hypothetical protein
MNDHDNLKTLGFKDMHEDQMEGFVQMVHALLNLADGYGDPKVFDEAKDLVDDVVILFGGNGVEVVYEIDA